MLIYFCLYASAKEMLKTPSLILLLTNRFLAILIIAKQSLFRQRPLLSLEAGSEAAIFMNARFMYANIECILAGGKIRYA